MVKELVKLLLTNLYQFYFFIFLLLYTLKT
nr:MAG TPA: holin family protein [Caudoviricetes sp.]